MADLRTMFGGTGTAIELVPADSAVFVTIDIDGLDPSVEPGVIGREPGGLTYFQTIEQIDGVAARTRIAGFDLVEFVPDSDVDG